MSTTRCAECHASIPVPPELEATTMTCAHCHASQPVPDLEARRRLLIEQQREARLAAEARAVEARDARREVREERDRHHDQREARRGRWGMRLMSLFAILAAPTIIAVMVFDLPARLGFGASGADRLAQVKAQLEGSGCTPLVGITSSYATGNVSRIVSVQQQCLRVFAAGGDGHRSLSLRLFSADGKEVARAGDTTDPQLAYCAAAPGMLRYEVGVSPAAKGRLSHMVLACPPGLAPKR